jgi:UDP-GlcNAc:undecaprenyl-phosphate GlcNAc-1-phosphate transferase
MSILPLVPALSFAVCFALTPIVRRLASRVGLVDRPDRVRKLHGTTIPVAGGIAILLAVSAALVAALVIPGPLRDELVGHAGFLLGLLLAGLVISALGVVDDLVTLRGRYKLLGQVLAVGIVMAAGVVVRKIQLFGWDVELGLLSVPFTLFWLLGAINSLNLIDGMDGLLSSVGLIVAAALGAMALFGGQAVAACVAFALAGALLAFLRYNFPPASIFLGDCGSMLIGLLVGAVGIQGSLKAPATVALCAPVVILTVPLFDTAMAIVRRKLTGRSIYATDRAHLHHCLLRRGLSNRHVLLLVSFFCVVAAAGALVSLFCHSELLAVMVMAAVAGVFVTTRLFGHAEFVLVKERLRGALAPLLNGRSGSEPREIRVRLQGSVEWEELWGELTLCATDLQLAAVCLDVNAPAMHEGYYASWRHPGYRPEGRGSWHTEIPVRAEGLLLGRVQVSGHEHDESFWEKINAVAKVIGCFTTAIGCRPSTLGRQPRAGGRQPVAGNRWPRADSRQPIADSR